MRPFLDHLNSGERPRVTYVSALGMEDLERLPVHREIERYLHGSDLPWTILRPGFFATNFGNYERENIEQRNIIFTPAGAGRTPFIDPRDIAEVAALTLTEERHAGKTYELTGPEAYSMHEVAALLSETLGRTIVYPEPSDAAYREALAAAGAPAFIAEYMISVYGLIRAGRVSGVMDTVEALLGRAATGLGDVVGRDFGERPA